MVWPRFDEQRDCRWPLLWRAYRRVAWPSGKADTHRSSRPDGNMATAMQPARLGRAFIRAGVWPCQTPISHRRGWPELCVWNFFTKKTLLERAGLRTGAPSMVAFLTGVWVSGTRGCLELPWSASRPGCWLRWSPRGPLQHLPAHGLQGAWAIAFALCPSGFFCWRLSSSISRSFPVRSGSRF